MNQPPRLNPIHHIRHPGRIPGIADSEFLFGLTGQAAVELDHADHAVEHDTIAHYMAITSSKLDSHGNGWMSSFRAVRTICNK